MSTWIKSVHINDTARRGSSEFNDDETFAEVSSKCSLKKALNYNFPAITCDLSQASYSIFSGSFIFTIHVSAPRKWDMSLLLGTISKVRTHCLSWKVTCLVIDETVLCESYRCIHGGKYLDIVNACSFRYTPNRNFIKFESGSFLSN